MICYNLSIYRYIYYESMHAGTGDSGKSTFFKQVNFLYDATMVNGNATNAETRSGETSYDSYTSAIYANILETMQMLLKSYEEHNKKCENKLTFKDPLSAVSSKDQ
jgi:hypothetical protein